MMDDREMQGAMDEAAVDAQKWTDENVAMGGVCDFCATPFSECKSVTTWTTGEPIVGTVAGLVYAESGEVVTGSTPQFYSPEWGACERCDPVIAKRDPALLADHVTEHSHDRAPIPPEIKAWFRADLLDLYTLFFKRARRLGIGSQMVTPDGEIRRAAWEAGKRQ
jgi:hypothetical protein